MEIMTSSGGVNNLKCFAMNYLHNLQTLHKLVGYVFNLKLHTALKCFFDFSGPLPITTSLVVRVTKSIISQRDITFSKTIYSEPEFFRAFELSQF